MRIRLRDVPDLGYLSTDNPPEAKFKWKVPIFSKDILRIQKGQKKLFLRMAGSALVMSALFILTELLRLLIVQRTSLSFHKENISLPEKLENIYSQCPIV
jgi:hypothetical protein